MRIKTINLKNYSFAAAKRAMKRLKETVESKKYNIKLVFILPDRKKVAYQAGLKKDTTCPYCGSKLIDSINGVICSGNKLKDIAFEIQTKREIYGPNAEAFLSTRANRFYDIYMKMGRALECDYHVGEEKRWRKKWN